MSFGEIRKGIERLASGKRRTELEEWLERDLDQWFEERLLPITKAIAERWGVFSARLLDKGKPLPNIDGLIGATALEHDLTLVTRNVKDSVGLEVTTVNLGLREPSRRRWRAVRYSPSYSLARGVRRLDRPTQHVAMLVKNPFTPFARCLQ